MAHAGTSGFSNALKENLVAYAFNLGGLIAGFVIAYQLNVFRMAPWAVALYPAVLGAKGIIEGLLIARLSTALHLGTVYPQFRGNTKSFYKLIEAVIVLTLVTSTAISAISIVFGNLFWGTTFANFAIILGVVVATSALGLALLAVTVKVAFVSFKRGSDPDIIVYPVMSAIATIFITLCYFAALILASSTKGMWLIALIGAVNFLLVLYIFPKNLNEPEFIKTIRESLAALMIVAIIVNITGTILKGLDSYLIRGLIIGHTTIYLVYPALVGLVSDVGSVIGSTATTKLALGLLKPRLSSIRHHAKSILSAWFASLIISIILASAASLTYGTFMLDSFYSNIKLLLVTNVVAVALIVILSYALSILTFQKGLDPDNFVIPIESAFAASITSVALLVALAVSSL